MTEVKEHRSLSQLFTDLMNEARTLLRQEVRLAKTELTEKASRVGKDVTSLAIGGAIANAGMLAIVAAGVMGLANVVPAWLAALIIGVVVAGIGLGMIQQGRKNLTQEDLNPRKTVKSLEEDKQWVKEQLR
jgi:Putative Actinobacterial Holin-X, holin superfamily III